MNKILEAQIQEVLAEGFAGTGKHGKIPGEAIGATGSFKHKGAGGTCYLSWGIAYGSDVPLEYNEDKLVYVVTRKAITLTDDADWKTYNFTLSGTFPSVTPGTGFAEGNFFDCYLGIEIPLGTWVASKWFNDEYFRRDLVGAEFTDITATFS